MEGRSIFVIRRKTECRKHDWNYSAQGTIGGVEDAIGYGSLKDARKFLSQEEARAYIDHVLPEWARELHCPVEVHSWELTFEALELSALLGCPGEEIPPRLLEPANGRLLVWRR